MTDDPTATDATPPDVPDEATSATSEAAESALVRTAPARTPGSVMRPAYLFLGGTFLLIWLLIYFAVTGPKRDEMRDTANAAAAANRALQERDAASQPNPTDLFDQLPIDADSGPSEPAPSDPDPSEPSPTDDGPSENAPSAPGPSDSGDSNTPPPDNS